MLRLITLRTLPSPVYRVVLDAGLELGEIYHDDHAWVFWPSNRCRAGWNHEVVAGIADKLSNLNSQPLPLNASTQSLPDRE